MNRRWYKVRGSNVAAVVTLALGLGAGMAIFSALYAVFWQPLPYPNPGRLVSVLENGKYGTMPVAAADARDLAAGSATLAGVGVYGDQSDVLSGLGSPQQLIVTEATPGLFAVLGMPMARGRGFTAGDMAAGAAPVAVISNAFWQAHYGGRKALGRRFRLNGVSYNVIGILPPYWGAFSRRAPEILVPLAASDAADYGTKRFAAIARLRPGVSALAAGAEAASVAAGIGHAHADSTFSFVLGRVAEWRYIIASFGLLLILGAAAFLLLLASVNVSCLLLARANGRRHEFAVRMALGAGRGRIARGIIREGLMLGLVGGVVGWWLAWTLRHFITAANSPQWLSRGAPASAPVPLLFGLLLSLATGLACSVAPAWQATRASAGTAGLQALQPRRLRGAVIAFEVALALVLTILSALFLHSLAKVRDEPIGFDASHVLFARIYEPQASGSAARVQAEDALARARALPGVTAAALAEPLYMGGGGARILAQRGGVRVGLGMGQVSPGFFSALGIARLSGRGLSAEDVAASPKVVVVNQSLARSWWPGENPLGKQITLVPRNKKDKDEAGPWTVVGVVRDSILGGYLGEFHASAYFSLAQMPGSGVEHGADLVLHTTGKPAALAPTLRRALQAQTPDAVVTVEPLTAKLPGAAGGSFLLDLFELAALLSLVLAIVGVYGTVSYWVSQRRQEMGVRLALGAGRGRLMGLVLGRTLRWAVVGAIVGTGVAVAAARSFRSVLIQVGPSDPVSIAAGVAVLLAAATLAGWLPAWRAAHTDAVEALRHE